LGHRQAGVSECPTCSKLLTCKIKRAICKYNDVQCYDVRHCSGSSVRYCFCIELQTRHVQLYTPTCHSYRNLQIYIHGHRVFLHVTDNCLSLRLHNSVWDCGTAEKQRPTAPRFDSVLQYCNSTRVSVVQILYRLPSTSTRVVLDMPCVT